MPFSTTVGKKSSFGSKTKKSKGAARELKAIVIIINVLLILIGAALIGVGILVLLDNHGMIQLNRIDRDGIYTDMSTPGFLDVANVLNMIVGGSFILLAMQSMCAVCQDSKCMLALYIGGLVLTVLMEIAVIGITIAFSGKINDDLRTALDQGIKEQFEGHIISDNAFSKALDEAQIQFQCCGLDNYTEFKDTATQWFDKDSLQIPKSCCHIDEGSYFDNNQYVFDDISCGRLPTADNTHIEKACYTDIKDWLEEKTYLLLGMAAVGLGAQCLALIVTTCLLRDVRALN